METQQYLLTVCIPSYNRPIELKRLLESIDSCHSKSVQILICEDMSTARDQISLVVDDYKRTSKFHVKYVENPLNYGYDKNLRNLIENAEGEYIVFMGDDDQFIPGALDKLIEFLASNKDAAYVLRAYRNVYSNGNIEYFRYYSTDKYFEPGIHAYLQLFLKSVFISGFTIKSELARHLSTDRLDGTLLYQLYLVAETCLEHPSAYFNVPITQAFQGGMPYFGNSQSEKNLYTPGRSSKNDINFIKGFFKVTEYIDTKHGVNSTPVIRKQLSKYSYPIMARWRPSGIRTFIEHYDSLRNIGLGKTLFFYVYFIALLILGKGMCDNFIRSSKRILGRRPSL